MSRLTRTLAETTQDRAVLDAAERDRVLHERARTLARKPVEVTQLRTSQETLELLQFRFGTERYALEARYVHRVIRPCELTRLPGAPPHLQGVTNLRGEILPVFDLREWFEVGRVAQTDETRWLVLGVHGPELCLWTDGVMDVDAIDPRSLHRGEREDRHAHELVRGVTQQALSVLDAARLLAHPDLFIGSSGNASQEVHS